MKKKILYIWKGAYPWDVRVEKFCTSLVNNGYDVYLLARWNNEEKKSEVIKSIKIYRAGFQKSSFISLPIPFNPLWKKEIEELINLLSPDLLIVREIMLAETSGVLSKKYNIPIIMDMAENYPAAMRDWKKYNKNFFSKYIVHNLKLPDLTEKRALKLMDKVIVVCEEQIQRLSDTYSYSNDKVAIVHNTPDQKYFEINNLSENSKNFKLIFGHHGFLTAEKSIKNFILGFLKATQYRDDIEFHVWGGGESYLEYQEIIGKALNKTIFMHGKYHYNSLNEILNFVDIGVIPYQLSDFNNYTIHNKIFDYFAVGKPVIVSEARPLKRIINQTQSGIYVDCENPNKIAEMIISFDIKNLKNWGINAHNAFKHKYNWHNDEKILLETVNEILNENT